MKTAILKSPIPYFGGKSRVAHEVWLRFGKVQNYVEPFFGSGAMLLGRPTPFTGPETVNDLDGFIANFWRALKADPVADHADWPVNENDLHARHAWLVGCKESMQAQLEGDPEWFDAKIAGWWVWGLCAWIGSGWCSGNGPWRVVDGRLAKNGDAGQGVSRQRPHLGDAGRGVNRQLPHLGNAGSGLQEYFAVLADRLRGVRVCCGDWKRVCGPAVTTVHTGVTAVFLDPPYAVAAKRDPNLYRVDSAIVADDVRAWCAARGDDPKIRIALCGYEGEHDALESSGWSVVAWKARGGFASQSESENVNAARERIWFSPYCIDDITLPMFAGME